MLRLIYTFIPYLHLGDRGMWPREDWLNLDLLIFSCDHANQTAHQCAKHLSISLSYWLQSLSLGSTDSEHVVTQSITTAGVCDRGYSLCDRQEAKREAGTTD